MPRTVGKKRKIAAVVVLSGGQDSAICLALAAKRHGADRVAAITFSYGQRHAIETRYAARLAKHFGIAAHKIVKMDFMGKLANSALLTPGAPIRRRAGSSCPTSVVEGRNAFFLSAAAVWAKTLGAEEVWTGVSEADSSGYPDCRAAFVSAHQKAMRLALDSKVRFVAPFLRMTKAQEWALAAKLGIFELVRRSTVTCYNGIPGDGCGKCPACRLRRRGLEEYLRSVRQAAPGCVR